MSRARASALVLVNWKGVFYERYLLDRHVTALEGANGAGKTTVMIAAYVVLLPDLSRLKFVNLGETASSGGDRGIWGRLGEPGPSYAALEVEVGPERRVAIGVYLERKAAPTLSLTPFLVSDLPQDGGLAAIFLQQHAETEEIRTLDAVQRASAELGARFETFPSAKAYFARLFELGISPLRLSSDEDRAKFNEMLRTSMTGGISRALTSELRAFLFKQESALFDTLSRMRNNLEACRRTRLEVTEARVLEREINGIHEAGHAMFAAVLRACRQHERESQQALEVAEQAHAREVEQLRELETQLRELEVRRDGVAMRLERALADETRARDMLSRITQARQARERLDAIEAELHALLPDAARLRGDKVRAGELRERTRAGRDAAQRTLVQAASGLASLQAGLAELHRKAHAFRHVRERLAAAKLAVGRCCESAAERGASAAWLGPLRAAHVRLDELCGDGAPRHLPADVLADLARILRDARRELDAERTAADRRTRAAQQLHEEHRRARAALATLGGQCPDGDLEAAAKRELGRLYDLELAAARAGELATELREAEQRATRQAALTREVVALGFDPLPSSREFESQVAALEARLRECEQAQRDRELAARESSRRADAARARLQQLSARHDSFEKLAAAARRLQARGEPLARDAVELGRIRQALQTALEATSLRAAQLLIERDAALALAARYETSSLGPDPELLRLAASLDGQLLAARYEDLDVEAARSAQARLGPLVDAIVVDDLEQAQARVLAEPPDVEHVWLVRAEGPAPLPPLAAEPAEPSAANTVAPTPGWVAVDLGHGLRLSRLPEAATLGRAARQRQVETLREQAERLEQAINAATERRRELEAAARDCAALAERWEIWLAGDPSPQLLELRDEITRETELEAAHLHASRELRVTAARLDNELRAARALLRDHHLLDAPDQEARAQSLRTALDRVRGAAAELERHAEARSILLAALPALGELPPGEHELSEWRRLEPRLNAERDALFEAHDALEAVDARRAAWEWADSERALSEHTDLVPELEAEHERALQALTLAEAEHAAAEAAWEEATTREQQMDARVAASEAHCGRARDELAAVGVEDPSPPALAAALAGVEQHSNAIAALRLEERNSEAELALRRERLQEAGKRQQARAAELEAARQHAAPALSLWQELAEAARRAGVYDAAVLDGLATGSSTQAWLEARSKRELLCDRLQAARGGAELARRIGVASVALGSGSDAHAQAFEHLSAWIDVRGWLLQHVPGRIAELNDPLLCLSRLRTDLDQLERRLERQESELRGTSGDVARNIDVQVRRAAAQVRRLNQALVGVSFGSIAAIRISMARNPKMEQILRALREGETQELLFQSNLPIEEALDEIFRRHAGGRSGGQRLVDYREYLDLCVEIQRRSHDTWERVNPSQVSTGEAIGVGAALMMVILSEWEREDHLLGRERLGKSLRFLFLDEANRLSRDNLAVLFDLCRVLDLQLLIAAPEVAQARGNTTYRLVRRVDADGREEVLVTGRRATLPGSTCPGAPESPEPGAASNPQTDSMARAEPEPEPELDGLVPS